MCLIKREYDIYVYPEQKLEDTSSEWAETDHIETNCTTILLFPHQKDITYISNEGQS